MKKGLFFMMSLLLTLTAHAADELVTLPEGVEPEEYTLNITHRIYQGENQTVENDKTFTALVAFSGNDVYLSGLAFYFPSAYVKGTLSGDKVTFESGQYLGTDQYGSEYLTSYVVQDGKGVITPFVFNYDAATRSLTFSGGCEISETNAKNGGGFYADIITATYTPGGVPPLVPVSVPEGLTTQPYLLIGMNSFNDENDKGELYLKEERYERPLAVGVDGDDLYIQGIVENVPEGWVKATKNDQGNYVVPKGQYIGTWSFLGLTNDYFITSLSRNNTMTDLVLTYNEADGSLTTSQTIGLSGKETVAEIYNWINKVSIRPIVEREATPATPEFTMSKQISPYGGTAWYPVDYFVPVTDVEGLPMVSEKLSFVFLKEKDGQTTPVTFPAGSDYYYTLDSDITEIPFGFTNMPDIGLHTIYFEKLGESEMKTWSRLGLQSIYKGNGVEHRSDIYWFDMAAFWQSLGITNVQMPTTRDGAIYSLSGQHRQTLQKGLNIVGGRKVLVK